VQMMRTEMCGIGLDIIVIKLKLSVADLSQN
jgi:hypothetical protein